MNWHIIKQGIPEYDDEEFYNSYYGKTLDECDNNVFDKNVKDLEIYITSFEGYWLAEYQIKTLKKFLCDVDFNIFFCDTNNSEIESLTLKNLCEIEDVGYIKLPYNKFEHLKNFSMKLGVDMTWIWYNCIKKRKPKYFGYLDHDHFLINNIWDRLKGYLDSKGMYGIPCGPKDREVWLIHVICCFFKYDFIKDINLDFRPASHLILDTGGCNYDILYKDYKKEDYYISYEKNKNIPSNMELDRFFIFMDENRWIHIGNSNKKTTMFEDEFLMKRFYTSGFLDLTLNIDNFKI